MSLTDPQRKNIGVLKEELVVSWLGTSLVMCFFGANFARNNDCQSRAYVQVMFLILAIFVCLWTITSHFNLLSFFLHRCGLVLIFATVIIYFIILTVLSLTHNM